jgi:hypothetical protein
MYILKVFVAIVAFYVLIVIIYVALKTTKMPVYRSLASIIEKEEAPEDARSRMTHTEEFLLCERFAYCFSMYTYYMDGPPSKMYTNFFYEEGNSVYAMVVNMGSFTSLTYWSYFVDGSYMMTSNKQRHLLSGLGGYNPSYEFDDYLSKDEASMQAHIKRLLDSGRQPVADDKIVKNFFIENETKRFEEMIEGGIVKRSPKTGQWRPTTAAAFKTTFRILLGNLRCFISRFRC